MMMGHALIVMGIGGLLVLDMPTLLSVWNIVLGVVLTAYAMSNGSKEE
jgi:hypothetical protein